MTLVWSGRTARKQALQSCQDRNSDGGIIAVADSKHRKTYCSCVTPAFGKEIF